MVALYPSFMKVHYAEKEPIWFCTTLSTNMELHKRIFGINAQKMHHAN